MKNELSLNKSIWKRYSTHETALLSVRTHYACQLSHTRFPNPELGFFSGLLHDLGKLNPYYQELFTTMESMMEKKKAELRQIYEPKHSAYSAWIARKLLQKMGEPIDRRLLRIVTMIIYGHHSRLGDRNPEYLKSKKFKATQQEMVDNLKRFSQIASEKLEFSELSWKNCLDRFLEPISFEGDEMKPKPRSSDGIDDFLEISVAFSCLLQADSGSFAERHPTNFNINLDTSKLVNRGSRLSSIRQTFQRELLDRFDFDKPISIVNAPTGIGKTKVFLDLIRPYRFKYQEIERVFYFSPYLALTEDFETRLRSITQNLDEILVYNHLFSGSIEEKRRYEGSDDFRYYQSDWIYDNESFSRPFVITTTHRLLMTIFSNYHADKLKLASFRNSLLIIDEVQTIPKHILETLIHILEKMFHYLNTRTVFVSATIPYELRSLPTTNVPNEHIESYLDRTKKRVSYVRWPQVQIKKGKTLVMANTRRKAATIYQELLNKFPDAMYLSTGIRKKDRTEALHRIRSKTGSDDLFTLVSTQVVEAGVDISFSHIFRENAPLDSIVQVMGRLNREAENDQAELVVFKYNDEPRPYNQLELNLSEEILKVVRSSIDLYSRLDGYYRSVWERNMIAKTHSEELDYYISILIFDKIWDSVGKLLEDEKDPVLIPDPGDWDKVKELLLKSTKKDYKTFSNITASMPGKLDDLRIKRDKFHPDVLEKNILLPKKDCLNELYDSVLGTDVCLVR
jgi:CRISPR-associated helicase Cas3/CRISPR-associated endonuclease Cas3-HD